MSNWTVQHQYTVYSIYTVHSSIFKFFYTVQKNPIDVSSGDLSYFLYKKLTTFFSSNMCTLLKRNCKSKNNYISVSKKYTVHISSIPTAWTARAQSTVLLNNVQPLVGNTWGNYKKWSLYQISWNIRRRWAMLDRWSSASSSLTDSDTITKSTRFEGSLTAKNIRLF